MRRANLRPNEQQFKLRSPRASVKRLFDHARLTLIKQQVLNICLSPGWFEILCNVEIN